MDRIAVQLLVGEHLRRVSGNTRPSGVGKPGWL